VRDIRDELRERLRIVELREAEEQERYSLARRELDSAHASTVATLHEQRKALLTIIDAENENGGLPATPARSLPVMRLPLMDYFMTIIGTSGPQTKEGLKDAARRAGYFDDAASAGRITHATVINMVSAGKVIRRADDRFGLSEDFSPQLFEANSHEAPAEVSEGAS
jgi:hypothetical protein